MAACGLAVAFLVAAVFGLLGLTSKVGTGIAVGIVVLFVYAGVVGAAAGRALQHAAWLGIASCYGVGAVLVPTGLGGLVAGLAAGDEVSRYVLGPLYAIGFVGSPVGLLLGVAWALVVRRRLEQEAVFA